jgi:hypothetical protein
MQTSIVFNAVKYSWKFNTKFTRFNDRWGLLIFRYVLRKVPRLILESSTLV